MRSPVPEPTVLIAGGILLALLCPAVVVAHNDGEDAAMGMAAVPASPDAASSEPATTYSQYSEHSSLMVAHILLMTLAWVFLLPIGVLLSISRSRYTLSVQIVFLAFNALGLFMAAIYNANTPDLYPNNAHHGLGWVLIWMVAAQLAVGAISAYAGRRDGVPEEKHTLFIPVSTEALAEHQRIHRPSSTEAYRFSNDSGQGTEPNTESLRSQSVSSQGGDDGLSPDMFQEHEEDGSALEKESLMRGRRVSRLSWIKTPKLLSAPILRCSRVFYSAVDRTILILGSVALSTGVITYSGWFIGPEVFSGLAHFIKGGVFFWYGILTLGRWAGCFAEIGWAWNINPSKGNKPSAEFVESFLIFLYGSTNVFLEHLAAWGGEWSAQDLEHISITFMFIGGGLCGMLIESRKIRDLLNLTILQAPPQSCLSSQAEVGQKGYDTMEQPRTYEFSMNPIPALIVLLLGVMMSSHHQQSMVSTMIHKQWGTLLVGAAFARGLTYIIFYLAPPTSILPSRPPSELITAFCLMAGGFIFMASAKDTVSSIERNHLDAMFVFTVAMGCITFLMAWIILAIAITKLVARKENLCDRLVGAMAE